MDKPKRSYYLPRKLINELDKECRKSGYVRERVVAAAIYRFLQSAPQERHKMLNGLHSFLGGDRGRGK
jgi:hypothetical protein